MPSETKTHSPSSVSPTCQNCKQPFAIEPEDFVFYEKIKVPPPTFCPQCRNMRRMAWREGRSLYHNSCKLCGKSLISTIASGGPLTVYCRDCWTSDKWDPMAYGRDYDFGKPFFLQYRELMEAVPRPALTGTNIVNSEFSHACLSCKNCYYVFWSYFSENSQYSDILLLSKDAFDSYVTDNSDHVYETLHSNRLYQVRFGYFADECLDSSFLFNCLGCSDCFGCVNLRKKKYCLFNKQLSKAEYVAQTAYWDLGSYARLGEAKTKFRSLYLDLPRRYAHILNSQNVTGDIIRDAKNCTVCFSVFDGVENCKYVFVGGLNLKDSYDVSGGGDLAELVYEVMANGRGQRNLFSAGGGNSIDVTYCNWAVNSSDLFGCIALKNKQYCIFNKQYTKDEYEKLVVKIIEHMNAMPYADSRGRTYRFGEFFPTELSAYTYNESFAFPWYPKTKEEVVAEGWKWREPQERSYQVTIRSADLPDHIKDVPDSILQETIGCASSSDAPTAVGGRSPDPQASGCATAFRITGEELAFYRKMNVALPRLCPSCRYFERLRWRNDFRLRTRQCMCGGRNARGGSGNEYQNEASHIHGDAPCSNMFDTTFPPEKPDILYCEPCYKAEFL